MRAVILAGGLGSRMGDLTRDTPKSVLLVAGEPLIAHQLRRLVAAGVTDIRLATGHLGDVVEAALGDGAAWGARLSYSREPEPRGTGGALALAGRDVADDDVVLVLNGDLLTDHDLTAQVTHFEETGADVSIHVREVEDPRRFGVVLTDGDRVTGFLEKPEDPPSNLVNAGTYVFRGSVLTSLPGRFPMSVEFDVFPQLITEGRRVVAYRETAYFKDVGRPEDLASAEADAR